MVARHTMSMKCAMSTKYTISTKYTMSTKCTISTQCTKRPGTAKVQVGVTDGRTHGRTDGGAHDLRVLV